MGHDASARRIAMSNAHSLAANHSEKHSFDDSLGLAASKAERFADLAEPATQNNNTLKLDSPQLHHFAAPDAATSSRLAKLDAAGVRGGKDETTAGLPAHEAQRRKQESLCELKLAWKQCSNRLSRLELSLDAVREGNLKLQRCIQEMNRTAIDQPAPEVKASPNESVGASGGKREKALQEELAKLHREIKETQERLDRDKTDLQRFKGQSRSGRFKLLLLMLWCMLRIVGFLGFLLLWGVTVSNDTTPCLTRGGFNGSNYGLT